ncbi:uncharacterized protein LOC133788986 [Humulus lupulus]|uniref:uncharacterized protein LOC133788986 n=1 Tax=Humulus lupulus TaxID=3486 RepID=UPI002B407987|nr:uncharacterized protein LOC133788986 [Humulus lupulus]
MGLLGFLQFSLKYGLTYLAWPIVALVYPLCASIRAIEANSVLETQKLNTYWVVFSLILLLEHALKLLEWFPLWPYIRLITVFSLVMPYFDGAFHVYKHVICPCLSVDYQIILNWFSQQKQTSVDKERVLTEVEKYIRENGTDALEKIIASKLGSGSTKSPEVKEIKAVSVVDDKLVEHSSSDGPNSTRKDVNGVKLAEKKEVKEPVQVSRVETKLAEVTEKRAILTTETKQTVPEVTAGSAQIPLPPKIFQKEWKCALCNVTLQSESTFFSHLQGRKHKDMGEATKANKSQPKVITAYVAKKSNQLTEGEPQSSAKNQLESPKVVFSFAQKQSNEVGKPAEWTNGWEPIVVRHDMSKGIQKTNNVVVASSSIKTAMAPVVKPKDYPRLCHVCNVRCSGKIDLESHLKGRKHLTQLQLLNS